MRWLKRILISLAVLLVIAFALMAGGWWQVHRTPDWYPQALSDAETRAAEDRAEQLWRAAHNRIAEAHARQLQMADLSNPAATQQALEEHRLIQVSFSAAELNAVFQKWSQQHGWEQKFGQYMQDPRIVLYQGRLIVVGDVKDLPMIGDVKASVHFEPHMTPEGQLDLRLVRTMGGSAPLPASLWETQKVRLLDAVRRRLPTLQQQAQMAPDGVANDETIAATMSKLLLQVLNHQPSEPVVFIPVSIGGLMNRPIPVRVMDVEIVPPKPDTEERLTLTVAPMNGDERAAFMQRIRAPYSTATAALE